LFRADFAFLARSITINFPKTTNLKQYFVSLRFKIINLSSLPEKMRLSSAPNERQVHSWGNKAGL